MPIGPNNRIEPGGPDLGQPTHFLPGRRVGIFTVTVPKEFTPEQRLTWTLTVNGQTTSIPLRMNLDYNVSPFKIQHTATVTNTPPVIRFEEKASPIQGPTATASRPVLTRTTALSSPLTLDVWADDDATYSTGTGTAPRTPPPPVTITWTQFRGAGKVTFDKEKPEMRDARGRQDRRAVPRQVLDDRDVQRAGRVPPARDRERLLGRRRRRRGVLLDDHDREGDGHAVKRT